MKQGTASVLFGCHSVMHSLSVLRAWIWLHGWPKWWELVCIFIHDIGHWGKDYLDDYREKQTHWMLGANVALRLFGVKGYDLVAGHVGFSNGERGRLYLPDKYSWLVAPWWWLMTNTIVEPKLRRPRMSRVESVRHFRQSVWENAKNGFPFSTHDIYLRDWTGGEDGT